MHDGIPHPRTRHLPRDQAGTPWTRQAPLRTRQAPPQDQAPFGTRQSPPRPGRHPPPPRSRAYWEIRSMCGRYASYWNGILLLLSSSSSAFYPAPQMPKGSKRDFSVLGKMASLFYPLPENAKFYTLSTCNQAFLQRSFLRKTNNNVNRNIEKEEHKS